MTRLATWLEKYNSSAPLWLHWNSRPWFKDSVGISCPHSDMFEKSFIRRCPRRQHFKIRRSIITTKYKISGKLAFQNKSDSCNRIAQEFFSCTKTTPLCKRHTKIQYKKKKKKDCSQHNTQQQLIKHKLFRWDINNLHPTCSPKTVPEVSWLLKTMLQNIERLFSNFHGGSLKPGNNLRNRPSCIIGLEVAAGFPEPHIVLHHPLLSHFQTHSQQAPAALGRVLEGLVLLPG